MIQTAQWLSYILAHPHNHHLMENPRPPVMQLEHFPVGVQYLAVQIQVSLAVLVQYWLESHLAVMDEKPASAAPSFQSPAPALLPFADQHDPYRQFDNTAADLVPKSVLRAA